MNLELTVLKDKLAVCRLPPTAHVPMWASTDGFTSITRNADELSIICAESRIPRDIIADGDWRCLKIEGPFALEGVFGVLASVATPLAEAGISILAVGTYDTDYVLLKARSLEHAIEILSSVGHTIT